MLTNVASERVGLTASEALIRLTEDGYNELPAARRRSVWHMALDVLREPMFLLLLACGSLYLLLGQPQEALLLLGFVLIVMAITLYQERKTERALEALRDLSSPRALVMRDGRQQRIAGREVVRDDVILLAEGDRVPADAIVLSATNLNVDESLLTGESVPVRKRPGEDGAVLGRPGGDDQPGIFSGTLVVKGQAIARVRATGPRTEMGKIGKALQTLETEDTQLQRQMGHVVRTFAVVGVGVCLLVVVVYGLTRGDWLNGFLAGLTLAMATLPEEFPVVLTIFLALGAWRMSQRHVLTRRVPAIEMLGAATALCVDKTGTLTRNQMHVTAIGVGPDIFTVGPEPAVLPEAVHAVVEYSLLASPTDPFDPMERAMRDLGQRSLAHTEHLHTDWTLQREYPLSDHLLAMSQVWVSPDGLSHVIAAKGAPEAIADLCHFDANRRAALEAQVIRMADQGLRVIGVADGRLRLGALPAHQHTFDFEFLGLLGLSDPVRPGVAAAVCECYQAGIRVLMITGDYPGTARKIAADIGLRPLDDVITGPELETLDDVELRRRIRTTCIFARVVPEQKLRIVEALKANGEVVAMTGDGVNDAPALKAAHIGIAMGRRGTDVAREAAALVLLDDNFASIVEAVRMGRRIYDNLGKAILFIFSVHLPIAGLALLSVLLKWPLALLPIHVVFLELIIDPACSVVFEAEPGEADLMQRRPRRLGEPMFGSRLLLAGAVQGLGVLAVIATVYGVVLARGMGAGEARMMAFTALVLADLGLIFANRSARHSLLSTLRVANRALWWVSGGAVVFLALALAVPALRDVFSFAPLHTGEILPILLAGAASILLAESVKTPAWQRLLASLERGKQPG
jgi:Ca2+-transporting ATPase